MKNKYQTGQSFLKFEAGGSHEENPYGGILQGFNEAGQAQLTQENETKFGNYVFSNERIVTKEIAEAFSLGKKAIGKTFAQVSEMYAKADTPTREDMMQRLTAASEATMPQQAPQGAQMMDDGGSTENPLAGLDKFQGLATMFKMFSQNQNKPGAPTEAGQAISQGVNAAANIALPGAGTVLEGLGAVGNVAGDAIGGDVGTGVKLTMNPFSQIGNDDLSVAQQLLPLSPVGAFFTAGKVNDAFEEKQRKNQQKMANAYAKSFKNGGKMYGGIPGPWGWLTELTNFINTGKQNYENQKEMASALSEIGSGGTFMKGGTPAPDTISMPKSKALSTFDPTKPITYDGLQESPTLENWKPQTTFPGLTMDGNQSPFVTTNPPSYMRFGNMDEMPLGEDTKFWMNEANKSVENFTNSVNNKGKDNKAPWWERGLITAGRLAPAATNLFQYLNMKDPEVESLDRMQSRYNPSYVDEKTVQIAQDQAFNTQMAKLRNSGASPAQKRAMAKGMGLDRAKGLSDAYFKINQVNREEDRFGQQFNQQNDMVNLRQDTLEKDINARNRANYDTQKSKFLSAMAENVGDFALEERRKNYPGLMGMDYDSLGRFLSPYLQEYMDKKNSDDE